jgi:hypothetical protein
MSDVLPCDPAETICTVCGAEPYQGCRNKAFLGAFGVPITAPVAKDINPKDRVGGPKFAISALPIAGLAQLDAPFRDGTEKYGPANWRDQPVSARVYLDAAFRHMALFMAGQEVTSDTGICHLAAAASNLVILLDARANGTMIDDRIRMDDPDVLEEIFKEIRERNGG